MCTTLRPTYLPYKDLYEYDNCAAFVADYLMYEVMKVPNELVRRVQCCVSSSITLVCPQMYICNWVWCLDLAPPPPPPHTHTQPDTVVSSTLVLENQKGNCFEYANLLASLLIGVGYDAYCVCGYATHDVTLLNQIRKTCPQLRPKDEVSLI